jgi:hypothetical protein
VYVSDAVFFFAGALGTEGPGSSISTSWSSIPFKLASSSDSKTGFFLAGALLLSVAGFFGPALDFWIVFLDLGAVFA